jgi:hypothetical protein
MTLTLPNEILTDTASVERGLEHILFVHSCIGKNTRVTRWNRGTMVRGARAHSSRRPAHARAVSRRRHAQAHLKEAASAMRRRACSLDDGISETRTLLIAPTSHSSAGCPS